MSGFVVGAGAALLLSSTSRADDVDSFLDAMEIDPADVSNLQTTGDLNKMLQVRTDLGILSPQEGSTMGWMYTGDYGTLPMCTDGDNSPWGSDAGDTVTVEFDIEVPSSANSFIFSFYFLSREYPIYVGSTFNDSFTVHLSSAAWNGNIVFDAAGNVIDVNNALFVVTSPSSLTGTGFHCGDGGGTGWVSTIAPVEPGETIHLEFSIGDVSDGIYDSGVLIDDFYWSELDPKQPYTGDPLQIFFLSPKRGSLEGGETTIVYGANFTSTSEVYFDGVQVAAEVLSDERISVVTPAHEAGFVDVTVKDIDPDTGGVNQELTLINGYTYYDTSSGDYPPEFSAIEPDYSHVDGGTTVAISGDYFQPGALVYFDDIEGTEVQVLSEESITVVTPPHTAGITEVVVLNPDGQVTDPPYPFTYTEDVPEPGEGGSGTPDTGEEPEGCSSGSCSTAGGAGAAAPLFGTALLLAAVRRRRAAA